MKLYTFVLYFVLLSTFAFFGAKTVTVELQPYYSQSGEKLLCSSMTKTFCLNVTNYPRDKIDALARTMFFPMPDGTMGDVDAM